MEYTVKDIIKGKVLGAVIFFLSVALAVYVALFYFDIVDLYWLQDLMPNKNFDFYENKMVLVLISGLFLLLGCLLFFSERFYIGKIKKNLAEFSEDDVLDQMNGHLLFVSKYGKDPVFFVTDKYIIHKNTFICKTQDVSWVYMERAKEYNNLMIRLRNNKTYNGGSTIAGNGQQKQCIEAMSKVCSDLLVGATKENKEKHKDRIRGVKEE